MFLKNSVDLVKNASNPFLLRNLAFILKLGSRKICFICFNESPLKMLKNAFYFILKAFFVLKIFKFLS